MARKLPPKDVVLVGFGWTAAILGQELTDAGLQVLALERGGWRDTPTDFAPTFIQDELRYYFRRKLFVEPSRETLTFRNAMHETALPMRQLGSFLPATGDRRPASAAPASTGTGRPGASCPATSSPAATTSSATASFRTIP